MYTGFFMPKNTGNFNTEKNQEFAFTIYKDLHRVFPPLLLPKPFTPLRLNGLYYLKQNLIVKKLTLILYFWLNQN